MELNTEKIKYEMDRLSISKAALAKLLNQTERNIDYLMTKKTTTMNTIDRLAGIFMLSPKDLIK